MGDRLSEIKARHGAATPGPWKRDRNWYVSGPGHIWDNASSDQRVCHVNGPRETLGSRNNPEADQEFIAEAWADIALLIADVERLRAELASLRDHPGGVDPQTGSEK